MQILDCCMDVALLGNIYISKGARLNIILKLLSDGRSQVKYILAHDQDLPTAES